MSKSHIAKYITESKVWQIGTDNRYHDFEAASLFGFGKTSLGPSVEDVKSALEVVTNDENAGIIDQVIAIPSAQGDAFISVCMENEKLAALPPPISMTIFQI